MWIVTVTPADQNASPAELKIDHNSPDALFDGKFFRWSILEKLMESGQLRKVEIDFRPTLYGVKRIRKLDGKFYLTVDNVIASRGYEERGDAWAAGERKTA